MVSFIKVNRWEGRFFVGLGPVEILTFYKKRIECVAEWCYKPQLENANLKEYEELKCIDRIQIIPIIKMLKYS